MNGLIMHILIALVWLFLSGNTNLGGLVGGLIAGFLLLALFRRALFCEDYVRRVVGFINFILFFAKDVVVSNIQMASMVLRKNPRSIRGYFLYYDVAKYTETEVLILSQFIGLTPGTTVAGLSANGEILAVHVYLDATEEAIRNNLDNGLVKHILAFTR